MSSHLPTPATPVPALFLFPVAGPTIEPLALKSSTPQGLTLGRHESCDLKLPASAEGVSRFHARFRFDPDTGHWRVSDLASRWGTILNGVKLTPNTELPIGEGDLIRVMPWTFAVSSVARQRGLMSADDTGHTVVRALPGAGLEPLRQDLLILLLEAAGAIHDAPNETALSERLIDAAVRGSGLANAAVLRPIDTAGRFEIIASRLPAAGGDAGSSSPFTFSRSLLAAAAEGQVAEIASTQGAVSHSIAQMNISAALCIPLMLGPSPAAFLYLDSRSAAAPGHAGAGAFCAALGRLAGLALANLKRIEIERRQAAMLHDLNAAAIAQKWVLPRRQTQIGNITVTGESRAGRYVGGDFFDVIDLGAGRVAVALGDVSGKGVEASVLMTATQGFLHAALQSGGEPGKAVTSLNHFIVPRRPETRFVTLWVAMLDPGVGTLAYVDAGHGYAELTDENGGFMALTQGDGPPLGVVDDFAYEARIIPLPAHGRLVIVSDGIVEQPSPGTTEDSRREFGVSGVRDCLMGCDGDEVAALFSKVFSHAGTEQLADDATAVCVRW